MPAATREPCDSSAISACRKTNSCLLRVWFFQRVVEWPRGRVSVERMDVNVNVEADVEADGDSETQRASAIAEAPALDQASKSFYESLPTVVWLAEARCN